MTAGSREYENGRGLHFIDHPLEDDPAMIDLNVKALVTLCHRMGNDVVKAGRGKILNVGSTAAHMGGRSRRRTSRRIRVELLAGP